MLARIQFHRGLKSNVGPAEIVHVELKLGSEFHDFVSGARIQDASLDLQYRSVGAMGIKSLLCSPPPPSTPIAARVSYRQDGNIARCSFRSPAQEGCIVFIASASMHEGSCSACASILPLVSEPFWVSRDCKLLAATVLLSNYRLLHPRGGGDSTVVALKESYGTLLGAHLYDSSVVLTEHLAERECLDCSVIVELGAGCGLVSIACAALFQVPAIATDLKEQLPLLEANVALNGASRVHCQELRWECGAQLQALSDSIDGAALFVAADVLYDAGMAVHFIRAASFLLSAVTTRKSRATFLVAQKNRDSSSEGALREKWQGIDARLCWTCVAMRAQVLVWKLELSPTSES